MPVYLCKPGLFSIEPWRHGIPVYDEPFPQQQEDGPKPLRRIRHSEVILVDDVIMKYDQYWLRLQWPGSGGKFAGFICLLASQNTLTTNSNKQTDEDDAEPDTMVLEDAAEESNADEVPTSNNTSQLNSSQLNSMRCLRNGLVFPSSATCQLLPIYDDGLVPPVSLPIGSQSIFCRICRDGLHEQDDETDNNENTTNNNNTIEGGNTNIHTTTVTTDHNNSIITTTTTSNNNNNNSDATYNNNNPLMAPCECAGSMGFVHYLCIEQWRCRSRHPEARNGTHCETCGKPYALPPPSSRPDPENEWLEAMPPHVMQALRQPHWGWQMGAALVRRKWLRPLAPILLSPLVALYCRARRLLKKRGVSRRRWACSLCRRRARWKCVRCLRSYYCSRQCQNVSWHIVHKHVCYKPSRFWSSCVVYGGLVLVVLPGVLRDPLLYDLALSVIPPSFYSMAVLGGALASLVKRYGGMDIRGRVLEGCVLVATVLLTLTLWGLVWAFFGATDSCWGWTGPLYVNDTTERSWLTEGWHRLVLTPAKTYFLFWDALAERYGSDWLCTSPDQGSCFPHLSKAYHELALLEERSCRSDLDVVTFIFGAAGLGLATQSLWRRPAAVRPQPRPHQD